MLLALQDCSGWGGGGLVDCLQLWKQRAHEEELVLGSDPIFVFEGGSQSSPQYDSEHL